MQQFFKSDQFATTALLSRTAVFSIATIAAAQTIPWHLKPPVNLIVPYSAGDDTDAKARAVSQKLDVLRKQSVTEARPDGYQRSATILSFVSGKVECLRIGSCYELISDILRRHFAVTLPIDPGREVNASGHLNEFAFKDASWTL